MTALLLAVALGASRAAASTAVVPDAFATVQSAIDSGADTVLIREGNYPERPTIDRAVALIGVDSGPRPSLSGMLIHNSNFWASPPFLNVRHLSFSGSVDYSTLPVHPRGIMLGFYRCALDSGLQVFNRDSEDIALLAIYNCRLRGRSSGQVDDLFMVADTVEGSVAWRVRSPTITDCWFRGAGSGRAIELSGNPVLGPVERNRIESYATGVFAEYLELFLLKDNAIRFCGTGIQLRNVSEVTIQGNTILDCDTGVDVLSCDGLALRENTIVGATTMGAWLSLVSGAWGLVAEGNVVGMSGGHGIAIEWSEQVVVRGNTLFSNGGTGVDITRLMSDPTTIERNIGFGNAGWGASVPPGRLIDLRCNDWFGNFSGAVNGVPPGATDLSVDPTFCGVESGDVSLDSSSPLVNATGCGQIGALGVGCGVTATVVQQFMAEHVSDGIRVVWQVAEGATGSEVWLERSEGSEGQAWVRPLTERSIENGAVVELDRRADPDRAYWYRLVALEGGNTSVIGSPILVGAQVPLECRLTEVGPNPGSGPVRIVFALKQAAAVEIDVFDIQGRRAASPGRGTWAAGTHEVLWDGRAWNGQQVPAGVYVVRYSYPGGWDRRAIVRVR